MHLPRLPVAELLSTTSVSISTLPCSFRSLMPGWTDTLSRPVPSRGPSNERSHNVERVKITITLEHANFLTDLTPSEHKSVGSHEQTKTVPVRAGIVCETRRGCSRPLGSRGTLRHGWPSRAGSCASGWAKQSLQKKKAHTALLSPCASIGGRWRIHHTGIMSYHMTRREMRSTLCLPNFAMCLFATPSLLGSWQLFRSTR